MRPVLHAPRMRKRSLAAAVLAAVALIASLLAATPVHALNDTGTGGVFVPATGRILDTKTGTGGFSTPMEAGTYRTIKVTGLAGLPTDGSVGAVSLNATVGSSSGAGTLFGRPDANSGRTTMLIYNGVSGQYTSNSATIAVGADGTIQVMTETSARLILDVQGYYTANTDGTAAGGFVPVAKRIVDTRSGLGATKATIAPGGSVDVQITGSNGVPSGASGVVVNLLAINSTSSDGYLTPYATGSTKPQNALHYAPSITTAMQAQVPLSSDGKITIANGSSTVNLVIDLQGYFTAAGTSGANFTPSYGRAYDSRATGNTALAKSETRSIQIAGKGGVPVMGSGITAVTLTLIVSHAGSAGYAQVYADGTTNPGTTAINFQADDIRTNTITVPLGDNGKIALRNIADASNYIVDVQGWYSKLGPATISCPDATVGSWLKSVPSDGIDCTIVARPADHSGETVSYILDDNDEVTANLSETAPTSVSVHVSGTAGNHTLAVYQDQSDGIVSSTQWFATFGDWTTVNTSNMPADGDSVSLNPELSVWTEDVGLPSNAVYNYKVWHGTDTSVAPITTSGDQYGEWPIPQGVLVSGETYSWTATVTADMGGQTGDFTTPPSTFLADSSVTNDTGKPDDASSYSTVDQADANAASDSGRAPTVSLASSVVRQPKVGDVGGWRSAQTMQLASVQGPKGGGLRCDHKYLYTAYEATFSLRRLCSSPNITAWGFLISVTQCQAAIGNATEIGLQWWDHTTRQSSQNAKHYEHCTYHFHGSITGPTVGHYVSYYDYVSFPAVRGFETGTAYVDTWGAFTITNKHY